MANHASSKKRIRQTAKRTLRNKHIRSTMRGAIKQARVALEEGSKDAEALLKAAVRRIDKGVSQGVLHRKTGSRYISRLSQRLSK